MSAGAKRVLFICVGNACRSQMAEAFARVYGSDVLIAASAGIAPAAYVARDTIRAMDEKGISLRDHFPKALKNLGRARFDLAINISGFRVDDTVAAEIREWYVKDPVALKYSEHCEVRDEIENRVMELILELRREESMTRTRLEQGRSRD